MSLVSRWINTFNEHILGQTKKVDGQANTNGTRPATQNSGVPVLNLSGNNSSIDQANRDINNANMSPSEYYGGAGENPALQNLRDRYSQGNETIKAEEDKLNELKSTYNLETEKQAISDKKASIQDLETQLQEINQSSSTNELNGADSSSNKSKLQADLQTAKQELEKMEADLKQHEDEIKDQEQNLEKAKADQEELRIQIENMEKEETGSQENTNGENQTPQQNQYTVETNTPFGISNGNAPDAPNSTSGNNPNPADTNEVPLNGSDNSQAAPVPSGEESYDVPAENRNSVNINLSDGQMSELKTKGQEVYNNTVKKLKQEHPDWTDAQIKKMAKRGADIEVRRQISLLADKNVQGDKTITSSIQTGKLPEFNYDE